MYNDNFYFPFFRTWKSFNYGMPVFNYLTIQTNSTGLYKEKGSKFLSFAYPVSTEIEIKEKVNDLKKEYYDARHHCFAYILDADKSRFRAFDDGEPNHSAGDPIIGQIRSKGLTNVLVVVVRYFGGTKLGVGGLIAAYKAAAEDALSKAKFIERDVTVDMLLTYDYTVTPHIMRLVKEFDLVIKEQQFEQSCIMNISLKLRDKDSFNEKVKLLQATGNTLKIDMLLK
jgi:uncharacterized YigZ family protein